jgi:hypothetical protein
MKALKWFGVLLAKELIKQGYGWFKSYREVKKSEKQIKKDLAQLKKLLLAMNKKVVNSRKVGSEGLKSLDSEALAKISITPKELEALDDAISRITF